MKKQTIINILIIASVIVAAVVLGAICGRLLLDALICGDGYEEKHKNSSSFHSVSRCIRYQRTRFDCFNRKRAKQTDRSGMER